MQYTDLTYPTPQQNLACDEALVDLCEEGYDHEILRLWEPSQYFVVVGYSSKIREEVDLLFCQENGIPIVRRCSGGGTVLQGPGCFNYSLILKIVPGPLKTITDTYTYVMARHKEALQATLNRKIEIEGRSDLALDLRKFSGNAQLRKRNFLLFHGTLLLCLDISLMEKTLHMPSKQPPYRKNRSHEEFLINLNIPARTIEESLKKSWNATEALGSFPLEKIDWLARTKYSSSEWNFKL